jgi:hypothetical protein
MRSCVCVSASESGRSVPLVAVHPSSPPLLVPVLFRNVNQCEWHALLVCSCVLPVCSCCLFWCVLMWFRYVSACFAVVSAWFCCGFSVFLVSGPPGAFGLSVCFAAVSACFLSLVLGVCSVSFAAVLACFWSLVAPVPLVFLCVLLRFLRVSGLWCPRCRWSRVLVWFRNVNQYEWHVVLVCSCVLPVCSCYVSGVF